MKRLIAYLSTLFFLNMGMAIAQAGDFAERRIVGFSDSGKYFAFEQFGVQDGSGFPYSEIFIVNTLTDSWAGGSPFRVRIENEQAKLPVARAQAAAMAQNSIQSLGIRNAGRLLVSNPPTEKGNDPHQVQFRKFATLGPIMSLQLNEMPMNAANCADLGVQIKGFSLEFNAGEGQPPVLLHKDNAIPSSRNCPLNYGISDVIVYENRGETTRLIVLVNVFGYGFEGPDRRFIAIPAALN